MPSRGFPEFGQFCVRGFPRRTQSVQVRCVCHSATPAWRAQLYRRRPESPRRSPLPGPGVRKKVLTNPFSLLYKFSIKCRVDYRVHTAVWATGACGLRRGGKADERGRIVNPYKSLLFHAYEKHRRRQPQRGALQHLGGGACKQQGKIQARPLHLVALFFHNSRNLRGYSHCCDACKPLSTPAEQAGTTGRANRTR